MNHIWIILAVFLAIENAPKEMFAPLTKYEFITYTVNCISEYPINHKIFLESLLQWSKIEYKWKENMILAYFDDIVSIEFEILDNNEYRIVNINN